MQTLRRKATENISIAPMVPTRLVDESRCTSHSSSASIQYFTSATTPNDIARSKINSPSERQAVLARASASEGNVCVFSMPAFKVSHAASGDTRAASGARSPTRLQRVKPKAQPVSRRRKNKWWPMAVPECVDRHEPQGSRLRLARGQPSMDSPA
eukprot:scaffold49478_cov61-Phaeocystis_antarctica.AAC.3